MCQGLGSMGWELFLVAGKVRNINNYKGRGSTCTISSDRLTDQLYVWTWVTKLNYSHTVSFPKVGNTLFGAGVKLKQEVSGVPPFYSSYCILILHGHLLAKGRFITERKMILTRSSGIGKYLYQLVFVYCLYRVSKLGHPHFY